MKNLFTVFMVMLVSIGYSQGFSLDTGVGISFPGGDAYEDTTTGIDLKFIQLNYKFSESWGLTVGLASSGHGLEDDDDTSIGLGRISIGPSYTLPLGGVSWEFKPQFIVSSSGLVDDGFDEYDIDKANGFVIGNSILFGSNEGFQFLANIDLVTGKLKELEGFEIDEDNGYTFFNIGVGVRYNF